MRVAEQHKLRPDDQLAGFGGSSRATAMLMAAVAHLHAHLVTVMQRRALTRQCERHILLFNGPATTHCSSGCDLAQDHDARRTPPTPA